MKKLTPTGACKIIKHFVTTLAQTLLIISFGVGSFFGFTAGIYAYLAHSESQKSLIAYHADNWPDWFPVLITRAQDNGRPSVQLEFLYLAKDGSVQQELHQTPGKDQVQADEHDSGHYHIEKISDSRCQVTLTIGVSGGDRKERYIYEIDNNRVYPQSYQLMAYFGWMFSAIPLGFLATFIFFFFVSKLYKSIAARITARKLTLTA
jgi:hypothetical protein